MGRGSRPSSAAKKTERPASGKKMVMAPVNTTSISAYIQLKRSGKLNMEDHPKCRSNLLFELTRVTPLEISQSLVVDMVQVSLKNISMCKLKLDASVFSNYQHQKHTFKDINSNVTTNTITIPSIWSTAQKFSSKYEIFYFIIYLVYCSHQWLC